MSITGSRATKLALYAIATTVVLSACSSSAEQDGATNLIEVPGLDVPGLDQLPVAQRTAFEDGNISTAEYSAAYEAFKTCANADIPAGEKLAVPEEAEVDPVSGYITLSVYEGVGGSPFDPTSSTGQCYENEYEWIELVWQLTDPTNVAVQDKMQLDTFDNDARPCLVANGVDVPAEVEVGTDAFGQFFVEYGNLVNAGKC